jgi:hypothetical protein
MGQDAAPRGHVVRVAGPPFPSNESDMTDRLAAPRMRMILCAAGQAAWSTEYEVRCMTFALHAIAGAPIEALQ